MKTTNTLHIREDWLTALAGQLESLFSSVDYEVPDNYKISCGFPSVSALGAKRRRIGECWSDEKSEGGVFEIFISPLLDDPMEVAAVVAHEMVHATVGLKAKHGPAFKRCAEAIGLEGKMTATVAGDAFRAWAEPVLEGLGPYPHRKLTLSSAKKPQVARMLKAECPSCRAEGGRYIVRLTQEVVDKGTPLCPTHLCHLEVERKGE